MAPSFDNWTILFLFFGVLSILVAVLFGIKFRAKSPTIYSSLIVLLFGITLIDWVLFWTGYQIHFPYLMFLWLTFCFVYGPLSFFYLKELSGDKLSLFQKALHCSSFVIVVGYNLVFLVQTIEVKQHLLQHGFPNNSIHPPLIRLIGILSLIHMSLYALFCWFEIRKFNAVKEVSNWAKVFTLLFTLFVSNFIAYSFLSQASFFDKNWDYGIGFSMLIFCAGMCYKAYTQPMVFNGLGFRDRFNLTSESATVLLNNGKKKYKNSQLSDQHIEELVAQLNELMETEQCYLNPRINLTLLAEKLNLSRNHTSQLINDQLGQSFFEYINWLRIQEAKKILSKPDNQHKIIEVAYMVGYSNKVSFFNAFKHHLGMTPSEFVASVKS